MKRQLVILHGPAAQLSLTKFLCPCIADTTGSSVTRRKRILVRHICAADGLPVAPTPRLRQAHAADLPVTIGIGTCHAHAADFPAMTSSHTELSETKRWNIIYRKILMRDSTMLNASGMTPLFWWVQQAQSQALTH